MSFTFIFYYFSTYRYCAWNMMSKISLWIINKTAPFCGMFLRSDKLYQIYFPMLPYNESMMVHLIHPLRKPFNHEAFRVKGSSRTVLHPIHLSIFPKDFFPCLFQYSAYQVFSEDYFLAIIHFILYFIDILLFIWFSLASYDSQTLV